MDYKKVHKDTVVNECFNIHFKENYEENLTNIP